MQTDPLKRWSNRVARCPHGYGRGLVICEQCEPKKRRKICHNCKRAKLIGEYGFNSLGQRRGMCNGCLSRSKAR